MSTATELAPEAAIALGLASTALPFARTPEEEAERWLRVLRLNGDAGAALQALGVSEGQLQTPEDSGDPKQAGVSDTDRHDAVSQVTERAIQIAGEREATEVATTDVLMAVMGVYGADFDRVLRAHGTSRDDLIEQLGSL
ncbi:MAG TPA: hypothetical protein VNX67_02960 [Solirubrobacteraceae bacterium]|jgi:hypothetical protein|nr:hypothetical protein [Solirubrobacteraceae bacterium]